MAMTETERRKLWVKAGGRCTLCKVYLLEGSLTFKEVPLGEGAHIVGQQNSAGSPRGLAPLLENERDLADNILLACSRCHTEIDKALVAELMTVEELHRRKRRHEDEIRHQTGLSTDRRTAVLRMQGWTRGAAFDVSRDSTARAVIESSDRFPLFIPSYDQQGIEIDLRHIAGEEEGSQEYYRAAVEKIDIAVRQRIYDGIRSDEIHHLSVFASARLPLLVYLGWALEDGVPADIYQRHRSTDGWAWPLDATAVDFAIDETRGGPADALDAALITNLSGSTPATDLPAELGEAPVYECSVNGTAHEDVIATPETLENFEKAFREFMSGLEFTRKPLQRLHIFGALPISPAITVGRSLKAKDLRPSVVLYDRTTTGYVKAIEF